MIAAVSLHGDGGLGGTRLDFAATLASGRP